MPVITGSFNYFDIACAMMDSVVSGVLHNEYSTPYVHSKYRMHMGSYCYPRVEFLFF